VRVALATCANLPRPDADLPILAEEFRRHGVAAETAVWNDPAIAWHGFDAVVVRSTWDYVGNLGAFERWIDDVDRVTTLVNSAPTLRWNLHKRYLLELAALGVDIIPTTLVPCGASVDWRAVFGRHERHEGRDGGFNREPNRDLVLKPAVSAGSFATVRVAAGDADAAERHRRAHPGCDFLVQPLLRSVVDHGETNLVCFGGRPSHAVHKGARWSGDAEQSRGVVAPTEAELALAAKAFAALESIGLGTPEYARVDCAAAADGRPLLMELELLEPSLFLDRLPPAAASLVRLVCARATP